MSASALRDDARGPGDGEVARGHPCAAERAPGHAVPVGGASGSTDIRELLLVFLKAFFFSLQAQRSPKLFLDSSR